MKWIYYYAQIRQCLSLSHPNEIQSDGDGNENAFVIQTSLPIHSFDVIWLRYM